MAFWAVAIPIIQAVAAAAAGGAASAGVAKAGSKKHLPPLTGGAQMMPPVQGSQSNDMVKAILMENIKGQYANKAEGKEASEAQAEAVAQDIAGAVKR